MWPLSLLILIFKIKFFCEFISICFLFLLALEYLIKINNSKINQLIYRHSFFDWLLID